MDAVTFAHFHRFFSLPDDPGLGLGKDLVIERGQIEFRGVTFAYQEDAVEETDAIEEMDAIGRRCRQA